MGSSTNSNSGMSDSSEDGSHGYPPTSNGHNDEDVLETIDWTPEITVEFFKAFFTKTSTYKPTGVNKHFHMLIAHSRFEEALGRKVEIQLLWDKMESLYDLDELDRKEKVPFLNDQVDFALPDTPEYQTLIAAKINQQLGETSDSDGGPRSKSRLSRSSPAMESSTGKKTFKKRRLN